jgi:hypothetical protein
MKNQFLLRKLKTINFLKRNEQTNLLRSPKMGNYFHFQAGVKAECASQCAISSVSFALSKKLFIASSISFFCIGKEKDVNLSTFIHLKNFFYEIS